MQRGGSEGDSDMWECLGLLAFGLTSFGTSFWETGISVT